MAEAKPQYKKLPKLALRRLLDHQRWLSSNGQFGERLADWDLPFDHFNLDGIDLSGAELCGSRFIGGSLRGARFIGADLESVQFLSCDIEGANFTHASILGAIFLTNHEKAINLHEDAIDKGAVFNEEDARKLVADDEYLKKRLEENLEELRRSQAPQEPTRPRSTKPPFTQDERGKPRPGG